MILKFKKPFGAWKASDITDQVSDTVGRALIDSGDAEESTAAEQFRSLLAAESNRNKDEIMTELRSLMTTVKGTSTGPPNGGGAVDFKQLGEGKPAGEQDEMRSF